jgi:hypothetical protein
MNIRKYAACCAFTAIPLLTKNVFHMHIIKTRGNISAMDNILALVRPKCKQKNIKQSYRIMVWTEIWFKIGSSGMLS